MIKSASKFIIIALICSLTFTLEAFAQNVTDGGKNFPFSQNPKRRTKPADAVQGNSNNAVIIPLPTDNNNSNTARVAAGDGGFQGRSSAEKLASVARTARSASAKNASKHATELYRVGTGDMLDIRLLNAESQDSTLFTVAPDGTIDYPLAGGVIKIGGMTNDEIEEILGESIKLYENPDVVVAVRNYASHTVVVSGHVDKPGDKIIRREAVYLSEVLKDSVPKEGANKALISRADGQKLSVDLDGNAVNETLVYPNDDIKLVSEPKFYYITGVQSFGEKSHRLGITLTQAIMSGGGVVRDSANKVFIRRKNDKGLLISTSFNLKDIKEGKSPDPEIMAGDTVEITK